MAVPNSISAKPTTRHAMPALTVRLTLLVRAYCHLCDDMREALAAHADRVPVDEIDVDADPVLEARWGDKVPVLLAGGRELCHYRLNLHSLRDYLSHPAATDSR